MSVWIELEGSPSKRSGVGDAEGMERRFKTTAGTGSAEATTQGYIKGILKRIGGKVYEVTEISVVTEPGYDVVSISLTGAGSSWALFGAGAQYNDGKVRHAGDQEFSIELGTEQKRAGDSVDYQGNAWSATWAVSPDAMVEQPSIFLVWKKWHYKNTAPASALPTSLPTTIAKAIEVIDTFKPGGTGRWEKSPPQLMYTLGAFDSKAKLLCVSIELEADGNFVCRIARFKYTAGTWPTTVYGTGSL